LAVGGAVERVFVVKATGGFKLTPRESLESDADADAWAVV
jgi:hypothetical protein